MFDTKGIEAAADVLDEVGQRHGWWKLTVNMKTWRDLDSIGRSEFLEVVEGIIRSYEAARISPSPA